MHTSLSFVYPVTNWWYWGFCFVFFCFFSFSSMPSIHSNDCNSCLKSQTTQFITQTWLLLYSQDLCLRCSQLFHLKYLNDLKLMQIVHYGLLLIVKFFKLTKDYMVCPKMAPINDQHASFYCNPFFSFYMYTFEN